jgi:rhodanese-related sulfurtransferase
LRGDLTNNAHREYRIFGPCYRCLYPEPPLPGLVPSCAEGGVLGILPGTIGLIQATEAVKLILGIGGPLVGRLLLFDALGMRFRELKLRKNPDCPICGTHRTIHKLIDYQGFCGVPKPSAQPAAPALNEIRPAEVKAMLDRGDHLHLIDVREPHEYRICRIPGARLIPLGELPKRLAEIDRSTPIVAMCRMSGRSAKAANILREVGYASVLNMTGGILSWSDQVAPPSPSIKLPKPRRNPTLHPPARHPFHSPAPKICLPSLYKDWMDSASPPGPQVRYP